MIISNACTINVLFAQALALASVINYARKGHHSLKRYSRVIIYNRNVFIIQAFLYEKCFFSNTFQFWYFFQTYNNKI